MKMNLKIFTLTFSILTFFVLQVFATDVKKDVTFRLFTQKNINEPQYLEGDASNITSSHFDIGKKTIIVTHGFLNNGSGISCIRIKDAYLEFFDYNVIIVDYEKIAFSLSTPTSKIKDVGEYYGKFIDALVETGTKLKNIHLIGHSLGAHISGWAGRSVKSGQVDRITGLDPGNMQISIYSLNKNYANFVDVIHTSFIFGLQTPIGHADYYLFGGIYQPGCLLKIACSHYAAVYYYAYSIRNGTAYPSRQCDNYSNFAKAKCKDNPISYMGENPDRTLNGNFYFGLLQL